MEKLQPICLLDNVSSYLYNAFTFGKNNIFDGSKELDKVTKGIILGDPAFTVANSNVTVYPLYKPKTPRSNYKYNSTQSALTTLLEDYIEPEGYSELIPHYEVLRYLATLQDKINNAAYDSRTYVDYLKLWSYIRLYEFNTKADELIAYLDDSTTNIPVANYTKFTNQYIMKNVNQATSMYSEKFGTIAVKAVDSNLQLVAKMLTSQYKVAIVHKGSFIMLCFAKNYEHREEFTKLMADSYDIQGDFTTFFINGVQTDTIVKAVENLI